jgi:cytochrome P450
MRIFGRRGVMFLSYELASAAFRDEESLPPAAGYLASAGPILGRFVSTFAGDEHRVRRAIVSQPVRRAVVPRYVEMIRQAAEELVDEIAPLGEAELVSAFTRRLPLRVISNLLKYVSRAATRR